MSNNGFIRTKASATMLIAITAMLAVFATAVPSARAQSNYWEDLAVLEPVPIDVNGGHAGLEMDPITGLFHVTNTTTSRIDIVDQSGFLVESYGSSMVGGRVDSWPVDVAISGDTIYVSYFHAGAVVAYDRATLAVKGGIASLSGLNGPVGIDADGGNVYVAERGAQRVQVYDTSLNHRRAITITSLNYLGPGAECAISPNDVVSHSTNIYILGLDVGACEAQGIWRIDSQTGAASAQDQNLTREALFPGPEQWYSVEVAANGTVLAASVGGQSGQRIDGLSALEPSTRSVHNVEIPFSAPTGLALDPAGTSVWLLARPPGGGDRMLFPTTLERCDGKTPTILGTHGPNNIAYGDEPEVVWTGAGDDVVSATGGDQTICSGHGDDAINTGGGRDRLFGGFGNDIIMAGAGIDRIWGGGGNDEIHGDGGSDRIWSGDGNDTVWAGSGADRVWGGNGDDTLNGMGGQDFMYGDAGDDIMQGNWQSDRLWGGPGNDRLAGAQGKDRLWGEAGDDELFGGVNTDYLNGGDGNDLGNGQQGKDNPLVPGVSGCEQLEQRISC